MTKGTVAQTVEQREPGAHRDNVQVAGSSPAGSSSTPSMPSPSPYVVSEWESGWWVEQADDKDVEKSKLVRGPFATEEKAIAAMRAMDAARRRRLARRAA